MSDLGGALPGAVAEAVAAVIAKAVTVAVIPALNEESCIGDVVRGIAPHVTHVIVVDNGSSDNTVAVAEQASATVVHQPERGYGAACLAGIERARRMGAAIVLFLDGDGSDDPNDAPRLLSELERSGAGIVLGVRNRKTMEPGAMAPVQRFGNWLAPWLLRRLGNTPYSDLPPFKAIAMSTLDKLDVKDRGHGFTVELLLRAHVEHIAVREIEVRCLARRGGHSKVSGTVAGSVRASAKIMSTVTRHVVRVRYARIVSRASKVMSSKIKPG